MANMFAQTPFNQNIGAWDVSRVTYMGGMFKSNGAFNQNINGWDVSMTKTMTYIFYRATAFTQDLSMWDLAKCQSCDQTFYLGLAPGWRPSLMNMLGASVGSPIAGGTEG